jgi:hypothetical protein
VAQRQPVIANKVFTATLKIAKRWPQTRSSTTPIKVLESACRRNQNYCEILNDKNIKFSLTKLQTFTKFSICSNETLQYLTFHYHWIIKDTFLFVFCCFVGVLQGDVGATARFMLEAVEEFVRKRRSIYLSQIYIVVLEQSVLVDLHNGMRDRYIGKLYNLCTSIYTVEHHKRNLGIVASLGKYLVCYTKNGDGNLQNEIPLRIVQLLIFSY